MIKFIIPLNPVTKKNHSRITYGYGKGGKKYPKVIPSKAYEKYETDAGWFLKNIVDSPINRTVNVKAHYYLKTNYITTDGIIDLNGLNQALHDVLVKYNVLHDDNCRIIKRTDGSQVFYDKANPRTEVFIEDIEE